MEWPFDARRADLHARGAGNFGQEILERLFGGLGINVNSLPALELRREILRRIDGGNFAFVDDDHAIAGHADFRQDVSGKNDGVRAGQALDEVADFDNLLGIEADGRLVQNNYGGIMDQRLGQPNTLLVAAREPLDQLRALVDDIGFFERVGNALRPLIRRERS